MLDGGRGYGKLETAVGQTSLARTAAGAAGEAPWYAHPHWPYWAGEECQLARTFQHNQPITVLLSYFGLQGSRRSGQPPGQLAYDVMQIAAGGGQPWIALSGTAQGQDDTRALPALQETYRFLARHESYYRDVESAAQVAVVYSRPIFEWLAHEGQSPGLQGTRQWVHEFRGCYAALAGDHVPFDVLYHEHIGSGDAGARWTAERLAGHYRRRPAAAGAGRRARAQRSARVRPGRGRRSGRRHPSRPEPVPRPAGGQQHAGVRLLAPGDRRCRRRQDQAEFAFRRQEPASAVA